MFTIILSNILTALVAWATQPATMIAFVGFVASLPTVLQKIKTANGANFWDKALEVAKIEALKVAYMNLSDEDKFKRVVDSIYAVFPKEAEKYKALIEEIAMIAYHAYVKPNLKTNVTMNSSENSPICDAGGNCKN